MSEDEKNKNKMRYEAAKRFILGAGADRYLEEIK